MLSFFKKRGVDFSHKESFAQNNNERKDINSAFAIANLANPTWTPRDYKALAKEGYAQNPIAYRCVRMISEAVASVPLIAKDEAGNEHELSELLKNPNPEQTGTELIEAFIGHLQIAGNAYIEVISINGEAKELAVLRPDTMHIIKGHNNWPIGWEQQIGNNKRHLWRDFENNKSPIMHLKYFNPSDDLYGQSPIEAAATAIDIHNAGGAWNKSLIDNAARPSGALIYKGQNGEGHMSDEQFDRLKDELLFAHTGAKNAGRPLLLEGGLEWAAMSLSPQEMDFIEARRQAARDIALSFGVSPMLLGIPGDNTYSNYKEANNVFWRQTIMPLVAKFSRGLEALLNGWSQYKIIITPDYDAISALASERESLWTRLEAASFLSQDEKRQMAGFAPLNKGQINE